MDGDCGAECDALDLSWTIDFQANTCNEHRFRRGLCLSSDLVTYLYPLYMFPLGSSSGERRHDERDANP